jgi:hypothetical protein
MWMSGAEIGTLVAALVALAGAVTGYLKARTAHQVASMAKAKAGEAHNAATAAAASLSNHLSTVASQQQTPPAVKKA